MIPSYLTSPAQATARRYSLERAMWMNTAQPALNDYLLEVRRLALDSPNSFTEGRCFLLWEEIVVEAVRQADMADLELAREVEVPRVVYQGARAGLDQANELSEADLYRLLTSILFIPPESLTAAGWKDTLARLGDSISRTGSFVRSIMERFARTAATRKYSADTEREAEEYRIKRMRWVAHIDDRTRESHLEANGQTVPRGTPFQVGGELLRYPGDEHGSPAETYNCRCVMVGVLTSR